MPLIINEVISDISIGASASQGQRPGEAESNPEADRAAWLLDRLHREMHRLTGRDADDPGSAQGGQP